MKSIKLPADQDLVRFFKAEPSVADPGVPWLYNQVTFTIRRAASSLTLRFAPSYRIVEIKLETAPSLTLSLQLEMVVEIALNDTGQHQALVVLGEDGAKVEVLLSPSIRIVVGSAC